MLENLKNKSIILGSQSPRRHELLKGLEVEFEIRAKDTLEIYPDDLIGSDIPLYLANLKAEAFIDELLKNDILITSDTAVLFNNGILNKPKNRLEAVGMLMKLSGNTHTVATGVCIKSLDKTVSFFEETRVTFTHLTTAEIEHYIDNYNPFDKAGSYGAQDFIGYIAIDKLEGSFYNVMGLPVHRLYQELKKF